jgi:hypothetical protein
VFFKEIVGGGDQGEDVETFPKNVFEFRKARTVVVIRQLKLELYRG